MGCKLSYLIFKLFAEVFLRVNIGFKRTNGYFWNSAQIDGERLDTDQKVLHFKHDHGKLTLLVGLMDHQLLRHCREHSN